MSARKSTEKVGTVVDLGPGEHQVTRPNGEQVTVTGDSYVLAQPGTYRLGEREVEAKP